VIDVRHVPDLWRRCDVTVRDLPFALLLGALSLVPALNSHGTQLGTVANRPVDAYAVVAVVLQSLSLTVVRRWPAACLALVGVGFALDELRGYHMFATIALPIAVFSVGVHVEGRRRIVVAVLSSAGYVALAAGLVHLGAGEGIANFVFFYLAVAAVWGAGGWLGTFRRAEAERRRHVAEATRTAERTRIARELHDVVTHHVTAMVVQTESARYLTSDPERLDQTLTAVAATGRLAIGDLRHLLDLLNPGHGTEPPSRAVGELRALVEQTRQAGQPVEFTEEGVREEAKGSAEITAYRVVQEALTNALKYDHGSPTLVHVRYGGRDIVVEVATDGSGSGALSPGGSGRGLDGLRERVAVLGGEFEAGRRPGGGFLVQARIPAGSSSCRL
jgi:signal transduction histidine kinase